MSSSVPLRFRPRISGFTLVELLTVIAILGVLAGILVPVIGSARASARSAQCVGNLRQLGVATRLYLADHNNVMYPHSSGGVRWHRYLNPYLSDVKLPAADVNLARRYIPYCPDIVREQRANGADFSEAFVGYMKNGNLGGLTGANAGMVKRITSEHNHSRVVVIWDDTHSYNPSAPNPDGGWPTATWSGGGSWYQLAFRHKDRCHILLLDGHVASLEKPAGGPSGAIGSSDWKADKFPELEWGPFTFPNAPAPDAPPL